MPLLHNRERDTPARYRIYRLLSSKLVHPTAHTGHADLPIIVPGHHTAWVTALDRIERVGARVLKNVPHR